MLTLPPTAAECTRASKQPWRAARSNVKACANPVRNSSAPSRDAGTPAVCAQSATPRPARSSHPKPPPCSGCSGLSSGATPCATLHAPYLGSINRACRISRPRRAICTPWSQSATLDAVLKARKKSQFPTRSRGPIRRCTRFCATPCMPAIPPTRRPNAKA